MRFVCLVAGDRDEPFLDLSDRLCSSADMDCVCDDKCHGGAICVCCPRVCVHSSFFLVPFKCFNSLEHSLSVCVTMKAQNGMV